MSDRYTLKSPLKKLNPKSKILATIIFTLITLCFFKITTGLMLIGFMVLVILISNIPFVTFYRAIKKSRYILLIIFILSIVLTFSITIPLYIITKIILIILSFTLLMHTTTFAELFVGFEKVLKPFKEYVKPKKEALKIVMGLKNISIFADEIERTIKLRKKKKGNSKNLKDIFDNIKETINLIKKNTKQKQKQFKKTMTIKSFTLNKARTNYKMKSWKFLDTCYLGMYIILLILIILKGVLL